MSTARSRSRSRLALTGICLAVVIVAVVNRETIRRFLALGADERVPVYVVAQREFVHQVSAHGNLRAAQSLAVGVPADVPAPLKIAWTCTDAIRVAKGDVLVRFEPTQFEQRLLDGQSQRATAVTKAARERVLTKLAERKRERSATLSGLELSKARNFRAIDSEIFSRNQILESGIDEQLFEARLQHADQMQRIEASLSRNKLEQIAVERRQAEQAVARARKGLASLELAAPADGIVILERDWQGNVLKVGDAVWAGATVARLPILTEMEAEVFVLEADAGGLAVGKPAAIVLEAYPGQTYAGKISRVATLAQSPRSGVPTQYFAVVIKLDKTDTPRMKPGGRVNAILVLDRQMALSVPRHAVFDVDGHRVVYKLTGSRFEAVPVKLGATTPGRVVITEGLKSGDTIALSEPSSSSTAALPNLFGIRATHG